MKVVNQLISLEGNWNDLRALRSSVGRGVELLPESIQKHMSSSVTHAPFHLGVIGLIRYGMARGGLETLKPADDDLPDSDKAIDKLLGKKKEKK